MDKKKIILEFIKKNNLCVVSTVGKDCKPQSAAMEFGETEDLELIFDTYKDSRKYKNIKGNKSVSVVIGWDENISVQYEGEAEEIVGEDLEKYKNYFFEKNPDAKKWEKEEGIIYLKVVPKWIRYSNLNTHPWEVFEVAF